MHNPALDLCPLKTRPGEIVGYVNGRPVRSIAGGSEPVPPAAPAPVPAPPGQQPAPPAAPAPIATAPPPGPATPLPPAPAKLEDLLADVPEDVRKTILDQVSEARKDAAKYRTQRQSATQQAQAAEQQRDAILKALGVKADGSPDVDPVQVAAEAQNRAWVAEVSLAIHTAATRHGADAAKLLDSVSFLDSLDEHVTAQPGAPEFASQVDAAITAALTDNPSYRTGAVIPPASGAPLPGAPGEQPKRPSSLGEALKRRRASA